MSEIKSPDSSQYMNTGGLRSRYSLCEHEWNEVSYVHGGGGRATAGVDEERLLLLVQRQDAV